MSAHVTGHIQPTDKIDFNDKFDRISFGSYPGCFTIYVHANPKLYALLKAAIIESVPAEQLEGDVARGEADQAA